MERTTYADQVWRYVVRLLENQGVIFSTDSEDQAVRFCLKYDRPAKVVKSITNEVIYENC